MSLGIQVHINAAPALSVCARAAAITQPERLAPVAGQAGVACLRSHLLGLNRSRPNRLGGKRTGYYRSAANATNHRLVGADMVVLSINHIGIRHRRFGGTLRPKNAKWLTIPVAPEAHGKRAREFGDLEVVFGEGGRPIGLATKGDRRVQITTDSRGRIVKKAVGRRGVILFRLVKSVTHAPDPTVLPTDAELTTAIVGALNSTADRLLRRTS